MGRKDSVYRCIRKRKRHNYAALKKATEARMKKRQLAAELAQSGPSAEPIDTDQSVLQGASSTCSKGSDIGQSKASLDPLLEPEVFPQVHYEIIDTFGHGYEIKISEPNKVPELSSDLQDEPKRVNETLEPTSKPVKPAPTPRPIKPKAMPVKRNPLRGVIIKNEIKKHIAAQYTTPRAKKRVNVNSTVNNVNSTEKDEPLNDENNQVSKKTTDKASHLNHMENLYEFGKYVVEEMMCLNNKYVNLAKIQIKKILNKYKLRQQTMQSKQNGKSTKEEAVSDSSLKTADKLTVQRPQDKPIGEPKAKYQKKFNEPKKNTTSASRSVPTGPNTSSEPTKLKASSVSANPIETSQFEKNYTPLVSVRDPLTNQQDELQLAIDSLNSYTPTEPPLGFVTMSSIAAPHFQITTNQLESNPSQESLYLLETSAVKTEQTFSPVISQIVSQVNPSTSIPQPNTIQFVSTGTSELSPSNLEPLTNQEITQEKLDANDPLFSQVAIVEGPRVIPIMDEPESIVIKYEEMSDSET